MPGAHEEVKPEAQQQGWPGGPTLLRWTAGVVFGVLALALALNPRRCIDFTVFRNAGARLLAGASLYRAEDGPMPFKYAPPVAVLFAPFALVPRAVGAVLWNLGSVGLLLLALARLPRVDPGPRDADASWAALALAGPVGTVLFYGQVDLWLLGLVTLAAAATTRDGGGVALGLAVLTKPPAAFAGLFFLLRRRWRTLAIAGAVVLVAAALFVVRVGPGPFSAELSAWRSLVERSTVEWVTGPNPQGLPTLVLDVAGWIGIRPSPDGLWLAQLAAGLFFVGVVLAVRDDAAAAFRMTTLAIALCSPLAWRANFVLALPAVRALVSRARQGEGVCRVLLLGVVLATVLTSGVFLDRTATERLLAFRPWGVLGLLLVVVEFSARVARRPVRADRRPG